MAKGRAVQATNVKISEQTLFKNKMTGKRKTALRRKLVLELIESKPAGTPITMREFKAVGYFSTEANTHSFVQRMIRDGIVARYDTEKPRKHTYASLGKIKTIKPTPEGDVVTQQPKDKVLSLTAYAKQFSWENNTDSLRGFVQWMDGKELEIRRSAD